MGGYAEFVWPSYAIAIGLIVALAIASWRSYLGARRALARLEAESPRRRRGS